MSSQRRGPPRRWRSFAPLLPQLDLKDPNPDDAENCELISRRAVDEEVATVIATNERGCAAEMCAPLQPPARLGGAGDSLRSPMRAT